MNYCSIEDAWGRPDSIKKQLSQCNTMPSFPKQEELSYVDKNITNNSDYYIGTPQKDPKPEEIPGFQHFNNDCGKFISHLKTCKQCQKEMRMYLHTKPLQSGKVLENFQQVMDENRDTIVLILTGIAILLFINLIKNITKD